MIRSFGITIHKEGRKILLCLFAILAFLNLLTWVLAGHLAFVVFFSISAVIFLFITNFFRSPKRIISTGPLDIVAPADGKVVVVEKTFESGLLNEERIQVSIFMSVFNVRRQLVSTGRTSDPLQPSDGLTLWPLGCQNQA